MMPKVTAKHFSSFQFVYPRSLDELLLYISALGGVNIMTGMPDLILLENVDKFPASPHPDETAGVNLTNVLRAAFTLVGPKIAK